MPKAPSDALIVARFSVDLDRMQVVEPIIVNDQRVGYVLIRRLSAAQPHAKTA